MSSVLYPVSLIARQRVQRFNRVVSDEFEDGSTSARLRWTAQYFKRRFDLQHAPLTEAEYRYLRSFFSQRSGRYDSFWFRDNPGRGGNAQVRFASDVPEDFAGRAYQIQVSLEEIAAIRALPELDELTTAAGTAPVAWFDANRERYHSHCGTAVMDAFLYDVSLAGNANWAAGTLPLGNILGQYQYLNFAGTQYALTPANLVVSAGQPALTLFCIAQHGTISGKQVLFALGAMGAGAGAGIAVAADNYYEPWLGGSETFTNARQSNATDDTWRSFAVVWTGSSNNVTLYVNAVSIGTDAVARSLTAGPLSVGAALDGTLKATGYVAQVMVVPAALSLAQVKAVHNLVGYQYGLATVS